MTLQQWRDAVVAEADRLVAEHGDHPIAMSMECFSPPMPTFCDLTAEGAGKVYMLETEDGVM